MDEDCFVSPVVKSDKTANFALDYQKMKDSCIERRLHIPNIEDLPNEFSVEITGNQTVQIFILKVDLDYAYGQMKLSDETSQQCVFAITRQSLADLTDSKNDFRDLEIYPLYSKRRSTEH